MDERSFREALMAAAREAATTPQARARMVADLNATIRALGGRPLDGGLVDELAEIVTGLHLAADHTEFILDQLRDVTAPPPAS